jgi:hypothetical protein
VKKQDRKGRGLGGGGGRSPTASSKPAVDYSGLKVGAMVTLRGKNYVIDEGFCINDGRGVLAEGQIKTLFRKGDLAVMEHQSSQ